MHPHTEDSAFHTAGDAPNTGCTAVHHGRRKLRTKLLVVAGLLIAVLLAGAALVPRAWQSTRLREAYLPQLEAIAVQKPANGRALALLGGRFMEAGDLPDAEAALQRAVDAGEKAASVWQALAGTKAALGDPSAMACLNTGAHLTGSASLTAAQARVAALGPGADRMTVAQAICPDGPQPLLDAYAAGSFLNGYSEWWGRRHPALSGFATREAWALEEPNDAEAQRLWGQALMDNRRLIDAAQVLGHAQAMAPNSAETRLAIADLRGDEGQPGQAAMEYLSCLRMRPNWLPALLGLGQVLLVAHLPATASKVYERAVKVAPKSADAWVGAGNAGVAFWGGLGDTLHDYDMATRLAPDRTDFFANYALALRKNGRWQDAMAVLRRRLAAVPQDSFAHYLLGQILSTDEPTPANLTSALAETERALALSPHAVPGQVQMADILQRQGKQRESRLWLLHVLAEEPDNSDALRALARCDQGLGMAQEAQVVAERAAAVDRAAQRASLLRFKEADSPWSVNIHQQLATADAQAGNTAEAQREEQIARYLLAHPATRGAGTQTLQTVVNSVVTGP